jgi:hypothetical protein
MKWCWKKPYPITSQEDMPLSKELAMEYSSEMDSGIIKYKHG